MKSFSEALLFTTVAVAGIFGAGLGLDYLEDTVTSYTGNPNVGLVTALVALILVASVLLTLFNKYLFLEES